MAWSRLEDDLDQNAKALSLSDKAFRLWINSITFSTRNRSCGVISLSQVRILSTAIFAKKRHVTELVEKGAWEKTDDGFKVHDYEVYHPKDMTAPYRAARYRDRNADRDDNRDEDRIEDRDRHATRSRSRSRPVREGSGNSPTVAPSTSAPSSLAVAAAPPPALALDGDPAKPGAEPDGTFVSMAEIAKSLNLDANGRDPKGQFASKDEIRARRELLKAQAKKVLK